MKTKLTLSIALVLLSFQLTKAQEQFALYFESNKYDLTNSENKRLQEWISLHRDSKIIAINGFADEDGTNQSNDVLAQKRVDFIFKKVNGKITIRDDFKSISFGEQFSQTKNKAANRKVAIYYILARDLKDENEILGIKPTEETPTIKPKPAVKYPPGIAVENPDGSVSKYKLDTIFMKKIATARVGEKLKIDNINFVINTFAVENQSRVKLYELLMVLTNNPNLKIEIQGHLCCMTTDRLDLSTQRAKAIYNFLVKNNIAKERLTYKGFGSSKPIYPLPEKDEKERAANRRIEIEIKSK